MYNLIACAVSKHEGRYLSDWINYHSRLGIERFVIYDEGSEHLTHKVLQDYAWKDIVEYVPATTHPIQYESYQNCINRYNRKTDWILFLDIDEFIVPHGLPHTDLRLFLKSYTHPNIGGIGMAWSCFGTSDTDVYEKIPLWERITKRVDYEGSQAHHTRHIKSFVRPQCVNQVIDPHIFPMKPGYQTIDSNGRILNTSEWRSGDFPMDKIWVAHYSTKTKEEWAWKYARGSADSDATAYNARKFDDFDRHITACSRLDYTVRDFAKKIGL